LWESNLRFFNYEASAVTNRPESQWMSTRTYLDKPGLPVLVLLVGVQFRELNLQIQGLDAHEYSPAVWGHRGVVDLDAGPTHGQGV
jgi:hypothetical protein